MTKTVVATGKFVVTFNAYVGGFEVGESDMNSIDFAGDDIDALVAEVIASDPSFPMTFERITTMSDDLIGVFKDTLYPDDVVAVMVTSNVM